MIHLDCGTVRPLLSILMLHSTLIGQFDLDYFFELSPDLLCVAGYDGYFKKINPAVSKTLGYSKEELFAVPINSFVHPDDRTLTENKRSSLRNGEPLLKFENRYLKKDGNVVWLSWTSMPIERDQLVFAIAKDVTYQKRVAEYERVSEILARLNQEQRTRLNSASSVIRSRVVHIEDQTETAMRAGQPSYSDQEWLNKFESVVRTYAGKLHLTLQFIANELAVSERQLFRQIGRILGITPNKLVTVIRLHLAWEAIVSGKYRTIAEISSIAGYGSKTHFKKLFNEIYGINVAEVI